MKLVSLLILGLFSLCLVSTNFNNLDAEEKKTEEERENLLISGNNKIKISHQVLGDRAQILKQTEEQYVREVKSLRDVELMALKRDQNVKIIIGNIEKLKDSILSLEEKR